MFGQKFFPYSTLQELNLDWILTKVKNILRFIPDDGAVGQILRRTRDGAEWSDEQGGGAVNSVNGQTGTVVLTASDVGALPDSYTAPVTSVNTKTGAVVLDKTDVGLGNVANVAQYSASNPPPYPVTSVNTKTGAVVLDKTDIGLGNVANVAQYSASNPPPYPVTSVNGQTGDVVIPSGGMTLLWTNPAPTSSFSAQTIPIDLSNYSAVAVFTDYTSTTMEVCTIVKKDAIDSAIWYFTNVLSVASIAIAQRSVKMTSAGVTFGSGYVKVITDTATGTQYDNRLIPIKIYGIKSA